MFIDNSLLRGYTQDEIDTLVNNLLVNVAEFSEIACMDGRAYGVKHLCDTCDMELDWCVRKEIIRILIESQDACEALLHFPISNRYVTNEITHDKFYNPQLQYPGLEIVNVKQVISDPYEELFDVNPYVYTTVALASSWIEVPTIYGAPTSFIFRDESHNQILLDDNSPITREGDVWRIRVQSLNEDDEVNVQSCNFIIVTAETVELEEDQVGYIAPVYPNSNQKIPYVKSDIVGDDTRWWFRPHVLLDPVFYELGADFSQGEFYKLLPQIEFRLFEQVEAPIQVEYWDCPRCDCEATVTAETDDIEVKIKDVQRGIVEINPCEFERCDCKNIVKVVLQYKVNPRLLTQWAEQTIKDAICMLTAAELPMQVCGCEISPKSYIYWAQEEYNTITVNPITGNEIQNFKYGFLEGQLTYKAKTNRVKKFHRRVKV